jgi:succinate dehydrogenase / fumarate reductase cytochrome b subunit
MADVNRGNRPLSPHLQVYRPQYTSVLSILHRGTGVCMTFSAVLVVWWFIAAATGPEYFETVNGLLTSFIGQLIMLGSLVALWYHFCNGIRHLYWDVGCGFDLKVSELTGMGVLAGAGVLTIITLFAG